jgi:hypothetical protein
MRSHIRLIPILCLSILAVACTPRFLNPMISPETLAPQPGFAGDWVCADATDGDPAAFSAQPSAKLKEAGLGDVYEVRVTFKPKEDARDKPAPTGRLLAGFITLNGSLFVNMTANQNAEEDVQSLFLQPVFTVARVTLAGDTLTYEALSDSWLDKLLKQDDALLEHIHPDGGGLLITASGERIREFIAKHANTAAAWQKPQTWRKKP